MDAIADAITTVSKKEYIRLYQREPSGKYVAINRLGKAVRRGMSKKDLS